MASKRKGRPARPIHCSLRMTRGTKAMLRDKAREYGMTQGALLERALSRYIDVRDEAGI